MAVDIPTNGLIYFRLFHQPFSSLSAPEASPFTLTVITHKEYIVGFVMTVAADVLYAFVLPLVELTYKKASQSISYTLVLKTQLVLCFVASCFCLVGMLASGDFKV